MEGKGMTDYTELVKVLRYCSTTKGMVYCNVNCKYGWEERSEGCKDILMTDAAAAIEALQADVNEIRRLNMELFDDLPKYGERFFCWVSMDEDKPKHDGQYITYNTDGFIYWNWWDKFGWAYSASDVLYWMKIDPPTPKGFVKSKCKKCGKEMLTPAIVFDPELARNCPNCGAKIEVQDG